MSPELVTLDEDAYQRRRFLTFGGALIGGFVLPSSSLARTMSQTRAFQFRKLHLYNVATGETFHEVYWEHGQYIDSALHRINYFMRDIHSDAIHHIDSGLLNVLFRINLLTHNKRQINITSGYRSLQTNNRLISEGYPASPKSMHLLGKAVDFKMPGHALRQVHRIALSLHAGGVGYYPDADFIHVDVGPVRRWAYEG